MKAPAIPSPEMADAPPPSMCCCPPARTQLLTYPQESSVAPTMAASLPPAGFWGCSATCSSSGVCQVRANVLQSREDGWNLQGRDTAPSPEKKELIAIPTETLILAGADTQAAPAGAVRHSMGARVLTGYSLPSAFSLQPLPGLFSSALLFLAPFSLW